MGAPQITSALLPMRLVAHAAYTSGMNSQIFPAVTCAVGVVLMAFGFFSQEPGELISGSVLIGSALIAASLKRQ